MDQSTRKRLNIVLAGEESAGIRTLRMLAGSGHRIVAVMASPRKANGAATLWSVATELGYETWPAASVRDPALAGALKTERVDLLINVHSLFVINDRVLDAPRLGCFNLHPGPLPRYAGLNAVSWAIYRGEKTHGVTVHRMEPEIDSGPIALQKLIPVEESDNALTLSLKCVREGLSLISRLVDAVSDDPAALPLIPQDRASREYFGREVPNGGRLLWSSPARQVVDFVRACDYHPFASPWGQPRALVDGAEILILKARMTGEECDQAPGMIGAADGATIRVACANEWILIDKVSAGNQPVRPSDLLRPGQRLGDGR
jgi:methionyl-tRNA formyltransferase